MGLEVWTTICHVRRASRSFSFFTYRQCLFLPRKEVFFLLIDLQVVHLTFERIWNLARETFAPVWSLSELFLLTNLVIKSLQKIPFENIQNRRPHGSSIKHGGFWDFWMCRASADDQSPDISSKFRWILSNSIRPMCKPRFRGFKSINQRTESSNKSTTQY